MSARVSAVAAEIGAAGWPCSVKHDIMPLVGSYGWSVGGGVCISDRSCSLSLSLFLLLMMMAILSLVFRVYFLFDSKTTMGWFPSRSKRAEAMSPARREQ
jgi:hypothetical protein